MSKNTEKLGKLFAKQMNDVSAYVSGTPVMLGKITSNLGLKLDSVDYTIPKGDYMVCRSAMLGNLQVEVKESGEHTHTVSSNPQLENNITLSNEGKHSHEIVFPSVFRSIQNGDRVLVAMVGQEYVVIDIILSSDSTFRG